MPSRTCPLIQGDPIVKKLAALAGFAILLAAPSAEAATNPLDLVGPVSDYKIYVSQHVDDLVSRTQQLVDAIKAGNLEKAKGLYATTRVPYEAIEPIAELFSDLDSAIDSRADDHEKKEADPGFIGFHRIEYLLFAKGDAAGAVPFADQLLENVKALQTRIAGLAVEPKVMVGGAAGLIEEVAASKISGEEDRYSGTDLYDFKANMDGAEKIVELVDPLVKKEDPALADKIAGNFKTVDEVLAKYRTADGGFETYDKLAEPDRLKLQGPITELAEDLAKLTGTLGIE
ncbi:MAG TPA: iron uptake system protein EfeO [Devosiaceae bacterium]|nr:iron uptake system protein EfeO [Devosiaceae bacterium]